MKKNIRAHCLKSGLQISSPSVCAMCRRSCRLAGSRGKRYRRGKDTGAASRPLMQ